MKTWQKSVLCLLILFTIGLSYLLSLTGAWIPSSPSLPARIFVIASLTLLMSAITVVPFYMFFRD